ncbi:5-formyltetrahydrofolate cyclo-ligase [Leucogyrophana mollusca]|uniref:5-formyltetrahydrofolate cyclo-ligase n=1 Tax=Leucogyrophana mollusca TaxID=85980 RepID=A0ACB8BCC4_9AGAM|nr:5-formyltetrahydrofolate cyclo-ligase [Leucogyrophana mollusca]
MSILQANKKALRRAMASKLRELSPSTIQAQSEAIIAQVLAMPAFQRCKNISCYLSMPTGEVDTSPIVANILRDSGKSLFVPSITGGDGRMDFVRLYDEEDLRAMPAGLWGIPEPTQEWRGQRRQSVQDASCEALDMILVPGVAFDRSLSRLGHGKGFYDRFITSYAASRPRPFLVALALGQQLVDEVPIAEHDWKMDVIVTPEEVIETGLENSF